VDEGSIRREVESLLNSHDEDAGFLEHAVSINAAHLASGPTSENWIGRHLGSYDLLEEVGTGGMGAVYRAVRADGMFDKQVAVKLIRSGLSTDFFISRFKNERQILSGLEHPNIARLIDGGVTEERLPYLVLEFVAGEPVDLYCARRDLSIADRLKLFRTVCSAVQYAHRNLVVHRDLKPANILVTEDGVPKLLDFGIAKILDPGKEDALKDRTLTVMRIMTPDFASPEQVRGDPVTTSSDIYSLGVILYVLLTGRRPYHISSAAPHEIIKAVCDTDPEKPSTAVTRFEKPVMVVKSGSPTSVASAAETELSRRKLRRVLDGDLDNIVLEALRKEPERRYATVEQFSEDIRRYLEHLPVIARKDTPRYRASKFILRHKAGVAAALAVALTLIAGLLITVREERIARAESARAERRFNDVRQLANSLMSEIHDSVATVPGTTKARRLIAERSLDYLDSLAQEAGSDLSLQSELGAAYVKVGDVQGQSYYANLGDSAGALASYRKALAIRETIAAADPGDLANRLELARCHNKVGEMQAKMGDQSSAAASYQKALALAEGLATKDPANREKENELFLAHTRIGYLREDMGDKAAALASHREAVIAGQRLIAAHPLDPLACHDLATAYNNLGDLLAKTGNAREGLETYRKGLAVCEWVSADDPQSTQANTRGWLDDYIKLGEMLTQLRNKKEAFENYQKAMHIARRLYSADPENAQAASDLADYYQSFGDSQIAFGERFGALGSYRQAVAIREQLSARDPQNSEARDNLAFSYATLGQTYEALASRTSAPAANQAERWQDARSCYQKSSRIWTEKRARSSLTRSERDTAERVGQGIARCDAALSSRQMHIQDYR
jgi:non-specific serine/threonine protein kinase/serine/threonine-protein kinase